MYIYVVALITGARGFLFKHFCKITRECVEISIDLIINFTLTTLVIANLPSYCENGRKIKEEIL